MTDSAYADIAYHADESSMFEKKRTPVELAEMGRFVEANDLKKRLERNDLTKLERDQATRALAELENSKVVSANKDWVVLQSSGLDGKPVLNVAFRGTKLTRGQDLLDDGILGLKGVEMQRVTHAVDMVKELMKKYPDAKLNFVGHSLGGTSVL